MISRLKIEFCTSVWRLSYRQVPQPSTSEVRGPLIFGPVMPLGSSDPVALSSQPNDPLDLSVVILTGGLISDHLLRQCLESVYQACLMVSSGTEIFLVDNASGKGLESWALKEFPATTLVQFAEPVGFCTGNNAAFRRARGRYVLQLNDDTKVFPDALAEMVRFMDAHPEAGAVGPRLVNPDGSVQVGYYARTFPRFIDTLCSVFGINRLFPQNRFLRRHFQLDASVDAVREVDQPAGASLFYRHSALAEAGWLDENFTFAFDDVDICWRLWKSGWKIYYLPAARVMHYGGLSMNQASSSMPDRWFNGLMHFYRKHKSPGEYLLLRIVLIAATLVRIPAVLLLSCWPPNVEKYHLKGQVKTYGKQLLALLMSFFRSYSKTVSGASSVPVVISGRGGIQEKVSSA